MNIADTAQADIDRRAAFEPCKLFLSGDEPVLSLRGYHVHEMNQRYVVVDVGDEQMENGEYWGCVDNLSEATELIVTILLGE